MLAPKTSLRQNFFHSDVAAEGQDRPRSYPLQPLCQYSLASVQIVLEATVASEMHGNYPRNLARTISRRCSRTGRPPLLLVPASCAVHETTTGLVINASTPIVSQDR
jgi:hypothetical protein